MTISCKTHCCSLHGCKYCDDNCPVVNREVEQSYICEDCDHHGIQNLKQLRIIEESISGIDKDIWVDNNFYDHKSMLEIIKLRKAIRKYKIDKNLDSLLSNLPEYESNING